MNIKIVDTLDGRLLEEAWALYHEAFRELNTLTVQRHLMYRQEFDDMMRDPRVQKYLYPNDDGTLCGFSTYTNYLDAMPLISPQYFERRWPQLYAERRIWYVGFVAVSPQGRARRVFAELIQAMCSLAAAQNGISVFDTCRYNDEDRHLSHAVELLVRRVSSDVQVEQADQQSYWVYEFPGVAS